jgi:hypothetical protein
MQVGLVGVVDLRRDSGCAFARGQAVGGLVEPDQFSGTLVELLSGVGHSPMLDDPPRTAALLLAFTAVHAAQAD